MGVLQKRFGFLLIVLALPLLVMIRTHRPVHPILLSNPGGDLLTTLAEVHNCHPPPFHHRNLPDPNFGTVAPSSDLTKKMLENRPEDALVKTVETVKTEKSILKYLTL